MDQDELAEKIAQARDEGWTTLELSDEEIKKRPWLQKPGPFRA